LFPWPFLHNRPTTNLVSVLNHFWVLLLLAAATPKDNGTTCSRFLLAVEERCDGVIM
jgi:hypothetical protein